MNKSLKRVSVIIIAVIVIAITVSVFFLVTDSPRAAMDWTALTFVLVSEIAMLGSALYLTMSLSESNKRIIRAGVFSTLVIYWAMSVLLMLIRNVFIDSPNTFVIVNIILIGAVAIICILLNVTAAKVGDYDRKKGDTMLFLQSVEKTMFAMKSNTAYSEFKTRLDSLYEKVKYSDKVGSSSQDRTILDEVVGLEAALGGSAEDRNEKVENAISQLEFHLKQRNMELGQGKRGGF